MANRNLAQLTELTTPSDNDFLYILDVSDTSENPLGTGKKIRKDKVDSGASKENIANKQNDLTPDGTGTKYPTVDAVNAVLPTAYSKVVYVNTISPTTATIFDTENPPVTNDNLLKNDTANLYIGTDASTWVYLTGTGYVTKTISSATSNFNTFGTTVDAGNSKTSHITRSGPVTLTGSLNLAVAKISTTPNTSAGSYDILTRNSSTTALEKKLVSDFVQTTTTQSITGRKNLNSDNTTTGGITIVSSRTTNTAGTADSAGLTILNTGTNAILIETGSGDGILAKAVGSGSAMVAQTFGTGAGLTLRSQGGTGNLLSAELGKVTISSAGKLSTTEVATTGNNVPNKTYVDGKITQTITNGITDKSPSEDAVFDALANVSRNIILDAVPSTAVTGTISETILKSYLITANTFSSSTLIKIPSFLISKTGTVGTAIIKIYFNSTNTLSGATQIATYTITGVNTYVSINRTYILTAGTIKGLGFTTGGSLSDVTTAGNGFSSATFDTTSDKYIITSCTLSNSADSVSQFSLNIVN